MRSWYSGHSFVDEIGGAPFLDIAWQSAAGHLLVLGLSGSILPELCLTGPQKLPFTCSYLAGKSQFT
jgi:hypothetical protein